MTPGAQGPEMEGILSKVLLVAQESTLLSDLDASVSPLSPPLDAIGQAFRHNLAGAISTLAMPVDLVFAGAKKERLHRLQLAAIFRAKARMAASPDGSEGDVPEPERRRAGQEAEEQLRRELDSNDGINSLARISVEILAEALQEKKVQRSAEELLRQGVVLIWGSFEVLCRDLFVAHLNTRPQDVIQLLEAPGARRLFVARGVDYDVLSQHGFNVSNKLGTILATGHDLSGIPALKDIFGALLPDPPLVIAALSERSLWVLQQRRHLIVHKRGIIDGRYVEATGDALAVGSQLTISPDDVRQYLDAVKDAGKVLLGLESKALTGI